MAQVGFPLTDLTLNLSTLTGSPKQCAWAETIRSKVLADADSVLMQADSEAKRTNADTEKFAIGRADLVARIERLAAYGDAKWWIDQARFTDVRTLLRRAS